MMHQPIIVIGAGVIGLSTAILLQRAYPSSTIIIVASEFPSPSPLDKHAPRNVQQPAPSANYASMWAGAHFRPIPALTPQLQSEAKLCAQTLRAMNRIAEEAPEAGVQVMRGVEQFDAPTDHLLRTTAPGRNPPGGDESMCDFRVLRADELPSGFEYGYEYQTYCVNPHVYCAWLQRQFVQRGGGMVRRALDCVDDAFDVLVPARWRTEAAHPPLVVNCSGRGFDRDPATKVIRGQTVLVGNRYHRTVTRQCADGKWAFLIPRPRGGGTVVGGTKELGDWEPHARPETREELLRLAVDCFPDFVSDVGDFDVVADNVGRRPWREGGMRIEIESLSDGRTVVHGYGAGGRGYEMSWGVAEEIVRLVKTVTMRTAKL